MSDIDPKLAATLVTDLTYGELLDYLRKDLMIDLNTDAQVWTAGGVLSGTYPNPDFANPMCLCRI